MGISSHSTPRRLYIFSTMRPDNPPLDNECAHGALKDYLGAAGLPFIEVEGYYAGFHELSFLVDAAHIPEEAVVAICRMARQECYLRLDQWKHGTMRAAIVYVYDEPDAAIQSLKGTAVDIGYFRSFSKDVIDQLGLEYTYRPDLDMYWTVWPTDTTRMDKLEQEIIYAEKHGITAVNLMPTAC